MTKILKYWLPVVLIMALIFPVGNKALASPRVYEVFMAVIHSLVPHISRRAAGMGYILFRKAGHFVTYGLMAYMIFRALRAGRGRRWRPDLLLAAAGISAGYASLVGVVGTATQQANVAQAAQQAVVNQAQQAVSSVSGVNLDEEAANMLRWQQAYSAAAKLVATADAMFQTLLTAIHG